MEGDPTTLTTTATPLPSAAAHDWGRQDQPSERRQESVPAPSWDAAAGAGRSRSPDAAALSSPSPPAH